MSIKLLSLVILALLLSGCNEPPPGYMCPRGEKKCAPVHMEKVPAILKCDNPKRAKFIIDCAKAANPMSDEEGEDLVLQCETTSERLFCVEQELNKGE